MSDEELVAALAKLDEEIETHTWATEETQKNLAKAIENQETEKKYFSIKQYVTEKISLIELYEEELEYLEEELIELNDREEVLRTEYICQYLEAERIEQAWYQLEFGVY